MRDGGSEASELRARLEATVEAHRRALALLEQERARLIAAQEVARVGSWETDLATLHVQWSAETYRIFGLSPETFTPRHDSFLEYVHPEDRAEVDAAFRGSFDTPEICTVRHRIIRPDGEERQVEERWHVITDGDGRPVRAMGTTQDLTERTRLEAQLLRAQRLESVGTLAGGIAHDLNNVLAPILTSVHLLQLDETEPAKLAALRTIEESATRGSMLVQQVLTFARGVEGKRIAVSLVAQVAELERFVRETFPKGIHLEIAVAPECAGGWIHGDVTQVHQVIVNLCVNARDAMPEGGTLRITLAPAAEEDPVLASKRLGAAVPPHHCLTVADDGVGMSAGVLARIFEPFYSTKPVGRGTGLGLSTAVSIVEAHGGALDVTSHPGRGSTFRVYLPAISPPDDPLSTATEAADGRGAGECILVVDDEAAIRSVTERLLARFGYRVVLAHDGADAVARLQTDPQAIDLVLTDMAMPVMDGRAMARALRALRPDLPIIGSSGYTDEMGAAEMRASGIDHILPKPYTATSLLEVVARALAGRGR